MGAEDTAGRLRPVGDEPSERSHERADIVRTLLVTLLAGQHSSVLGPPGRAEFHDTARARGDIAMITDDDCGVTEQWTRAWNATGRRPGFRVFGLVGGVPRAAAAGSALQALCDDLRLIEDLTDVHTTAGLSRVM
ncbi:hypothetical protein ADK41_19260 [Streptomyces caelestis]|uniref:Uncharacterized protein n=1 Tax=Streptomyces caelestis TaxID=36816 RepID=A0A0M9X805_9ACTN|nr:hypothetical protein ADK41_19260 [Streptomyces caelestis]KOV28332.1 hypothetical protein ADK58_12235 [Streptomyces sp. XY152]